MLFSLSFWPNYMRVGSTRQLLMLHFVQSLVWHMHIIDSHGSLRAAAPPSRTAVLVQVYGQALCGHCRDFVLEHLNPVYEILSPSGVMELQMILGGASIFSSSYDDDPDCSSLAASPHGTTECDAHSYIQCAKALYPTADRYFPFVVCLYQRQSELYELAQRNQQKKLEKGMLISSDDDDDNGLFAQCAQIAALDWPSLQACHENVDSVTALRGEAMAQTAEAIQQQRQQQELSDQTLPMIVVNGQFFNSKVLFDQNSQTRSKNSDMDPFLQIVCTAYQSKNGGVALSQQCPATVTTVVTQEVANDYNDDSDSDRRLPIHWVLSSS